MDNSKYSSKELAILEAAGRVFNQKNFYTVKVKEIAEEAGVGKGTIYEYFDSKEDLFKSMLAEGIRFYKKRVSIDPCSDENIWDKLEEFTRCNLKFICEHQQIALFLMKNNNHPMQEQLPDWLLEVRETLLSNITETIKIAQERGEISADTNQEIAAKMFLGVMSELMTDIVVLNRKRPDEQVISEMLTILKKGI